MVEEGEEDVQSQETELETEEEGMPIQADIPSLTDVSSSQETLTSQSEPTPSLTKPTPSQTGARSNPEAISALPEITAAVGGPEAAPAEADTCQDATSMPQETK